MSLHDVGSGMDRGNPQPKVHNHIVAGAVMAHGTNSVNYVTEATDTSTTQGILGGNARFIYSDTVSVVNDGVHNSTTEAVPHGLGYRPLVIWSIKNATVGSLSNVDVINPTVLSFVLSGSAWNVNKILLVSADSTNVYFQFFDAAVDSQTINVTFYLYQQTTNAA